MSFGTLHKIQCDIERQVDEIRKVRMLMHQVSWELEHRDDKENANQLVSEAMKLLTALAN